MTSQQQFIEAIAPAAVAFYHAHRISAALTIAQACLETGFGKAAPGNNLFGIKSDPSWHGPTTTQYTREVVNGKAIVIVAKFRAYATLGDSLADHAQFLLEPGYKNLIGADYVTACNEIAGVDHYATDPTYGREMLDIIHEYGLAKYDLTPPVPSSEPLLKLGSTGADVVKLQQLLHITPDGSFGPQTETYVKSFQIKHGLTADGVVGPQTWAALNGGK